MYILVIEFRNGERYHTNIPVEDDDDYSAKRWVKDLLERLNDPDIKKARVLKEIVKYKKIKEF